MYETGHKDKNIILGEINKEIQRTGNEIYMAQERLKRLADVLSAFISK